MNEAVVVGVGVGAWFPRGLKRLEESLVPYRDDIDFKGWYDEYPPNCRTHANEPYEFKRTALEWAKSQGYRVAIWADCSCWFVKHPRHLIQTIKDRGYWLCTLGWNTGEWTSDRALPGTGYTRDKLMHVPMVAATFYGLDLASPIADRYFQYMAEKQTFFRGPYANKDHEASTDYRVKGHRHDQTFLSVFAHNNKCIIDRPPCFFDYAKQIKPNGEIIPVPPHDAAVAIAQGM